jgi:hypothetical protein
LHEVGDRSWRISTPPVIAAACLIFSNGCAAAPAVSDDDVVVVGANHAVSPAILSVTVNSRVPENGKKIGVTANFSESEPRLERLSIVTPEGRTVVVPRSYFEKVQMPRERSLSLAYILAKDSKTVAGIWVFLDFGELRRRADLNCTNDTGDPVFESFTLFYDTRARTFETTFKDYCGEQVSG